MKKKEMLLSVLALIGLIVITTGVTFAFFNYAREGSTENTVTTGSITFLYTETSGVGRGITLTNAFPISDSVGKQQVGDGNVFDFKVTSISPNKTAIPYEITARKKSDSSLDESAVKIYLTKVNSGIEEEVLLSKYSKLTPTTKVDSAKYTEKTIYTGKVPANSTNYEQAFKLRMWIDEETDFSPNADGTYPNNGKTFTVTVNVYANAKIVTESDIALEKSTNISSITVDGVEAIAVSGQNYDYETILPSGTTSTTINVETESPYATVNVEKLDGLVYSSNIKRLSTSKTLDLNPGDNYFKVTVTSENKEVTNEYKVKISVDYYVWNISYTTGKEETLNLPYNGKYKLEVWGAQGGNGGRMIGGYGGYSTGEIILEEGTRLFINIGGVGSSVSTYGNNLVQEGGYNGGGTGHNNVHTHFEGGGGGATHIALVSGQLKDIGYDSFVLQNNGLIVAGGGGGAHGHKDKIYEVNGGSGGGFMGTGNVSPTQITGYSFGQGEGNDLTEWSGGGGGLFGGFIGSNNAPASGGSGYLISSLTNKAMYCYNCEENDGSENSSYKTISTTGNDKDSLNCPDGYSNNPVSKCAKSGNGYARITYLGN